MDWVRIVLNRIAALLRRRALDAELDEELRSHIEFAAEENRKRGLSPEEAHTAALREFGGVTQTREAHRVQRGFPLLEMRIADVRYALRQLRRSPGFTSVALITLALGIGANTAVFSVIEAVLLKPLPYRNADRLVLLTDPQDPQDGGILYRDFQAWKRDSRSVEEISAFYRNSGWSRVTLTGSEEPVSIQAAFVSADLFSLLGIAPELGRTFTEEEESRHERVAVLSYGLWQSHFGGSPDAIGQTIQLDGVASRVIGVMPEVFQFPAADSALWAPITSNPHWADPTILINDGQHSRGFYARWQAVARLRPGFGARQAQAEMNAIFASLEKSDPDPNRGTGIKVLPLRLEIGGDARLALYVLLASVGLLLLIACSNVANLVLARGVARAGEIAMRQALGATRRRILGQLLTEALVLAALAGIVSLPVARFGIRALVVLVPANLPRLEQTSVNLPVLGFTFVVAMLCAVFFGLAPAFALWRNGAVEKFQWKNAVSFGTRRSAAAHRWLIVAEFALSVVLLTCAGLLLRSFLLVRAVDPGFEAEHVLKLNVSLSGASSAWPASLYDTVVSRLQAVPGVKAVGAIDSLFDLGATNNLGLRAIEGRTPESRSQWTALTWDTVRGDYFTAIGARLVRGRYFNDSDDAQTQLVAIIDESMARRYWPGENPIGKHFKGQDKRGRNDDWLTVIGLVGDMHTHGLERSATPHVFEWYRQAGNGTPEILVRTSGDPVAMASSLRAIVRSVNGSAVLSDMTPIEHQLQQQLAPRRFQTTLVGIFSLLALAIAFVGIYGLMHYSVAQRRREIGIRMALGADRSGIAWLVVRECLALAAMGLIVGLALSWFATRAVSKLLYGVKEFDPVTLILVSLVLVGAAVVAGFRPARRAASVDPMQALRSE
ncbi:MAG TPA: ABC transporter permease [Terracidiphilus sp.]|nr:ABC transporter permease [Terracidiphilus sp.]